jgi:hypothetical protein
VSIYSRHISDRYLGIDGRIARHGWDVQHVFGVPGEYGYPTFDYTIGMAGKSLPDIIVFGLQPRLGRKWLNAVVRRLIKTGVPDLDTDLYGLTDDLPARLLPVPRRVADTYLFQTKARYPAFTALQLVWCDENSLYPWNSGFSPRWDMSQIILRDQL